MIKDFFEKHTHLKLGLQHLDIFGGGWNIQVYNTTWASWEPVFEYFVTDFDVDHLNVDFETIIKMKTVMDKVNSTKNSPEANLLLSLKPYLNNNRKQKLDQYMQFLNITKVLEAFNSNGGGTNNDISK